MNQFAASMAAALAMMIAGVTSGFADSIMTALSLRSIDDVQSLKHRAEASGASSPCPAPGVLTLRTTADSAVVEAMPRESFGHAATLTAGSDADKNRGAGNQRLLVAFDLGVIHPFCQVKAATLSLWATAAVEGRELAAYRAGERWNEATVSWSTQPAAVGRPASTDAGAGWQSFDVTDQAKEMREGRNNGLIVRDSTEDDPIGQVQVFQSRDAAPYEKAPALVVTVG